MALRPLLPRTLTVALLAGSAALLPAAGAVADSSGAAVEGGAGKGTYAVHLSGGDTVILDPRATTAEVGANAPEGTLSPAKPGPITSGYSGWKYRLFLPASKPDLNPPYVEARFKGERMRRIYFTPSGKKPASPAPLKDSSTSATNSNAVLLASGGAATVVAALGFAALRRHRTKTAAEA